VSVKVLESNVLHAGDVVYWLDGTSAEHEAEMRRVVSELDIEFTARPRGLNVLRKAGQLAVWRRPDDEAGMVPGLADEAARARPAMPPLRLAGIVRDLAGRYNPRAFDLTLGSGAGHALRLYPTPGATRIPKAGALLGTLRLAGGQVPVAWALLSLAVAVSGNTLTFSAQADGNGDFVIALRRLPPLPESVSAYDAVLTIKADLAAHADLPIDPAAARAALAIGRPDADAFHSSLALSVTPGEVRLLRSFDKNHLAVQPQS